MDRFLQLFGRFVQFSYAAWDRIVLRGYYERLQRPENIVFFFRTVCGQRCITPEVLAVRTVGYRRWVENYAKRHAVPLITPPAGTRKEEFVGRFYQRYRQQEGVVVILKSMEQSPTFISYEPRYRPASGDDEYRLIKRASKRFLHYYFYVMDPVMGPMSLCVSSYPAVRRELLHERPLLPRAAPAACRRALPQGRERDRQLRGPPSGLPRSPPDSMKRSSPSVPTIGRCAWRRASAITNAAPAVCSTSSRWRRWSSPAT